MAAIHQIQLLQACQEYFLTKNLANICFPSFSGRMNFVLSSLYGRKAVIGDFLLNLSNFPEAATR